MRASLNVKKKTRTMRTLWIGNTEKNRPTSGFREQSIAKGNMSTLEELTSEAKRPKVPRSADRLKKAADFKPDKDVELDEQLFFSNIRRARRGISGGISGLRNEHLKCLVFFST